jgi:fatty acyl-CoA reductase
MYLHDICTLTCFDNDMQIPADMVINCVITAIYFHSNELPKNFIYHISSSLRNPIKSSELHNICHQYFIKNPCINQNGKPIVISKGIVVNSFAAFNIFMIFRYVLLLMVCLIILYSSVTKYK